MNLINLLEESNGLTCGGAEVLRSIKFVYTLLNIFLVLVPIALIVMISLDFAKAIIADNEEDMKKTTHLIMKRLVNCVALFLIIPVTNVFINLIGDNAYIGGRKINPLTCIIIAKEDDLSLYELNFQDENYEAITPSVNIAPSGVYATTSRYNTTNSSQENKKATAEAFLQSLNNISKELETAASNKKKWIYSNRNTKNTFEIAKKTTKSTNCALYINWGLIDIGVMKVGDRFYKGWGTCGNSNCIKYRNITEKELKEKLEYLDGKGKTAKSLIKSGDLIAGDIVLWSGAQHTNVYAGDNKWYDAGRQGGHNGSTKNGTFYFTTLGPVKLSSWENSTVWKILRIK